MIKASLGLQPDEMEGQSYGSHAPAWEPIQGRSCVPFDAGASRAAFPRRSVGTIKTYLSRVTPAASCEPFTTLR
ncbi:hypothetical protein D3C78_574100 [compost metagenome]